MSGTGKSTLLAELGLRGYCTVDTDYNGWCIASADDSELVWDVPRMTELLAKKENPVVVVSGCVSNQRLFYHRFTCVVLLTAPTQVIMDRLLLRDTNHYGKTGTEREQILEDIANVEPLLRLSASVELDTRIPVDKLADVIEELIKNV
jgi:dephospho-CoA kinase